ncbi:MAG TPA: HEAT repeat domain-containing protein [Polyangia bacterium]|nr:HEAT repeat domain-containing protein [Polyangia bacterium]
MRASVPVSVEVGVRRPALLPVALAVVGVLGAFGCRRSPSPPPPAAELPPPPLLGEVAIGDRTPPGAVSVAVDAGAIERELRRRLLASGLVIDAGGADGGAAGPGAAGRPVTRLRGEFALDGAEVPGKALARAAVRLQLDTRPSEAPGAIDEQLEAQGEKIYPLPKGQPHAVVTERQREVFTALVERVAGDLLDGALARLKLKHAPPAAIAAALAGGAGELREAAIRAVGERGLREHVPRLLTLLTDDDEATRDAALGALITLKEPRAVAVLTKSRSLRDRREMQKIIEAIAVLGGEEALDYLSFVAATHDDEEIRAQAAQAYQRLLRRADAAQKSAN